MPDIIATGRRKTSIARIKLRNDDLASIIDFINFK